MASTGGEDTGHAEEGPRRRRPGVLQERHPDAELQPRDRGSRLPEAGGGEQDQRRAGRARGGGAGAQLRGGRTQEDKRSEAKLQVRRQDRLRGQASSSPPAARG